MPTKLLGNGLHIDTDENNVQSPIDEKINSIMILDLTYGMALIFTYDSYFVD